MPSSTNESTPDTAIIVGAGCSYSLGVPTMTNFMDTVFDELGKGEKDSPEQIGLGYIKDFLRTIKSSAAYVQNQVLNIEELYGLADMAEDLGENFGKEAKKALNRAIFKISSPAGEELVDDKTCKQFSYNDKGLQEIKRESHTEGTTDYWPHGSKYTNLLAYLCLAHHKDQSEKYPLFIQFNWDLALDRALLLLHERTRAFDWYCGIGGKENYDAHPMVARPHGGIHWINGKGKMKGDLYPLKKIGRKKSNIGLAIDLLFDPKASGYDGKDMKIVPPTWRKQADDSTFKYQWASIKKALKDVRRIIFIGYSLPKTDLSFRYFLSLALGENDYCPQVHVWNPDIFKKDSDVHSNYLSLFEPLAREGRLFGIEHYFGDPACFDLERALRLGKPIKPYLLI